MSAERNRSTTTYGILGGIAAGKSAVSSRLAGPDGLILDADAMARDALAEPAVIERLREHFGPAAIGPDGLPDRAFLARRVFNDPAERATLEGWIHPLVRARILARLADAKRSGVPRVVLDVPLLLENDAQHGFVAHCDHLVFVEAPAEERQRRTVALRQWSPDEPERREAAQLPLEAKRKRADFVVHNSGSLAQLDEEVRAVLQATGQL